MSMSPPPLVGRAAVLTEIVRRARGGTGSVLTGSHGLGGTRLLNETYAALRRARIRVGRLPLAPPGEQGRTDPFVALLDRTTAAGLRAGDRGALRASVLALRLQVLIIDDAHLLDGGTGALVVELARDGVAVVANATGPGGMPEALQLLVSEGRTHRTELVPLTPDEVVELAEHLLGDPVEDELAQALMHASAGRPASLTELVEDGVAQHAIVDGDGLWRLAAPLPPPRSLRARVMGAFAVLPPDQRGWVAAVATGGAIADDLARRIAAPATIAAAAEAGWTTRDDEGTYRITSAPLAAAVLSSIDQRARLVVLRRLAAVAKAAPRVLTERERVALLRWCVELGDQPDADEAFSLAMRPGTDDESRETLLRAAVAGGAPAGAALAEHLRRTRRASEALDLVRTALPEAETDVERISLLRVAAMTTGVLERRSADALEALDARIAEAGPHRDLLAVRAALLLLEARPRETVEVAEVVLRSDVTAGFATSFALMQRAMGLRELGHLGRAVAAARRFAEVAEQEQASPQIAVLARWLVPETMVSVGRELEAAEAALTAAYDAASLDPQPGVRGPLAYTLGAIRLEQADPRAAIRLLREADAGSGSWREGWQPRILSKLTIAHALCGALDEARATHERLQRMACPPVQRGRTILAAAVLAAARGEREQAISLAHDAAEHGRRHGLPLDRFDAEFAALRYGEAAAARRLLDLGPLPEGAGRAAQRAYAGALLADDPAAVDAASMQLWRVGLRLYAIEAAARADELGAPDASARLIGWLTRTPGLQLSGITDRRAGVLTVREREVAMLAAGGASDRAIAQELGISLRTAQTHLGRAFTKLGVHRRAELRDLVGEC